MINTDKYTGHTEGPWVATQIKRSEYSDEYIIESGDGMLMTGFVGLGNDGVNAKLMADAPLLLAEVKRLREAMKTMLDDMNNASPEEDIEYWLDTWKHWLKEMIE